MGYFINYAKDLVEANPILTPVAKALETLAEHKQRILRRWRSSYTNARLEGLNSLFQAGQIQGAWLQKHG
jgi:transposase